MRTVAVPFLIFGLMAGAAEPPATPVYPNKANLLVYQTPDGKSVPIQSIADWQIRRNHILANMQAVMGPMPPDSRKVPLDLRVEAEDLLPTVVRKKVSFSVEAGDRVTGYLLMPRNLRGKAPAVLCLHQTTAIGSGEPAGVGGLKNLHYARELAERGYITLAPDYPNFGRYKTDVYAHGYASATMKGVWNHMRAVDVLQALPEVLPDRVGCIGHSLGGHNTLFLAAFDPRIQVAVTSCGFNAFPKYMGGNLSGWSHKGYMPRIASEYRKDAARVPFDFPEVLAAIAPRAVFVNAPARDGNFAVDGVRDCMTAASPVFRLLGATDHLEAVYPDAAHDFPPETRLRAYATLDRHLRPRAEFTRMIAHWDQYGDDDYLKFVAEARPEVCQLGFYGGHFYGLAHTAQFGGYPAHFPVRGLGECGKWFEDRNTAVHKLGAKVVGHFNVTFLVGDPDGKDGPRGFFKFYRDLWDEKELGPKPVADPLTLLARNADGTPMSSGQYGIGGMKEYTACLNNPHWRAVLKAWARRGIERGVDGYIANYFYRHDCLCEHCQAGFRTHLTSHFSPDQLRDRFQIADVKTHKFTEIVGWHDPKTSTPLRREMLTWSQFATKEAFDDVFVRYARSLKPGLLVAQWNHLGDFHQLGGDERTMLPGGVWGRDEDYLWYSTGGAANFTDIAAGVFGDATLQARYIRGAFDDKPFTLGKYEATRTRATIAELAANGGAPMGFYARHKDPAARQEIVRYYRFLEQYDDVYRGNRPHAEIALTYPRTRVHDGDLASVEAFKALGKDLLNRHVLFDVVPDDLLTPQRTAEYRLVLDAAKPTDLPAGLSTFIAAPGVRVSASRPAAGREWTLHFVNYYREEPAKKRDPGRGIVDEKPMPAEGVSADFVLPERTKVASVSAMTPEEPEAVSLPYTVENGRVRFVVPKFLVYAVVRVRIESP